MAPVLLDQQATEDQPALPDLKETEDLLAQQDLPVHWVLLALRVYRATQDRKDRPEPPDSRVNNFYTVILFNGLANLSNIRGIVYKYTIA